MRILNYGSGGPGSHSALNGDYADTKYPNIRMLPCAVSEPSSVGISVTLIVILDRPGASLFTILWHKNNASVARWFEFPFAPNPFQLWDPMGAR